MLDSNEIARRALLCAKEIRAERYTRKKRLKYALMVVACVALITFKHGNTGR